MILRQARREELDKALEWAAAEGWNPGLDDAAAFWAADPLGFFLAEVEHQPVAFISVVNHCADHAFLGLYLCHSAWRGKGIGLALWRHAILHAGTRSIALDGVDAQQANYAKSGFVRVGATQRWEGQLLAVQGNAIRLAEPQDLALIQVLDTVGNGYCRAGFCKKWIEATPTRQTVIFVDGSGFATVRRCVAGIKIGPVLAPTADMALQIVQFAANCLASDKVVLDLPEENTALASFLADAGFCKGFKTARMVKGVPPNPTNLLQVIATMELG
ncbi:MAG: GNAT family N-acetyltransferase [Rhodobacteraceae bacterium]|jgi:GNAT superfamily N-acetyltransferase|nr:GNAT family N-acetyltransferase [Paracoccaceae bacterium]